MEEHKKWVMSLDTKDFMALCQEWNDKSLKLKLPKDASYDEYLNTFKSLSPNMIKKLATTGLDCLTTEGYSALARWHDIIKTPGRIDKIHQSGLTKSNKGGKTIVELAQSNDRLAVLYAVRDRLAQRLEAGAGARDTASLSRELGDILDQIGDYERRQGPKKGTKLEKLIADKRPYKAGGGVRVNSFKSRVTIEDKEGE